MSMNAKERRRLKRLEARKVEEVKENQNIREENVSSIAKTSSPEEWVDYSKMNAKERRLAKRKAAALEKANEIRKEESKPEEPKKKKRSRGGKRARRGQHGGEKRIRLTLFVGQLPFDVTKEQIQKHFEEAGPIQVRLRTDKTTGKPLGTAFIELSSEDSLGAALSRHHTLLNGRRINVEMTANGGGMKSELRRSRLTDFREKQKTKQLEKTQVLVEKFIENKENELKKEDVDSRLIDFLAWFDYETAKRALEECAQALKPSIRNRKAYLMGILKRYRPTDGLEEETSEPPKTKKIKSNETKMKDE